MNIFDFQIEVSEEWIETFNSVYCIVMGDNWFAENTAMDLYVALFIGALIFLMCYLCKKKRKPKFSGNLLKKDPYPLKI